MTFSLRRKLRTIVRGKNIRSRTACSLALLAVLVGVAPLFAQQPVSRYVPQEPAFRPADNFPNRPVEFQKPGSQAATPTPGVVQTQAKEIKDPLSPQPTTNLSDDLREYQIRLVPPTIGEWSRVDSEKMLEERMRQESIQRGGQEVRFPPTEKLSNATFQARTFNQGLILAEPRYVSNPRLYFEEKNAERYGWDLGFIQPVVSAAYFYKDVMFLPQKLASYPFRRFDTSAGKCLPGDPVPYILYPPEVTLSGGIAEAGVIVGLTAVFP